MAAVEACLPLKLTAIAATPDLRINVWVLAAARAVPINYAEITINQAKLDWFNAGRNYDQLLKEAANEAQGNAFAVEYAKPARDSLTWFNVSATARAELASARTPLGLHECARPRRAAADRRGAAGPAQAHPAARDAGRPGHQRERRSTPTFLSSGSATSAAFAPFDPAAAAAEIDTEVLMPMSRLRGACSIGAAA